MSELQAAHLTELADGKAANAALSSEYSLPDADELRLTRSGVSSAVYGSLNFMTPITELAFDQVTSTEAGAYNRWHETYQENWRQFFDPIAIRFSFTRDRLEAKLTV